MKKTALSLLILNSSLSFAGTMGPVCTPENVTVPCASTYWDFGIQALYLKPTYSGNQYWYNFSGYQTDGENNYFNKKKADWDWAFRLEGAYHFGTGSDLAINWTHFDHGSTTPGITYISLISGKTLGFVYDTTKLHWDAVNAEIGQHADFGVFKNIRYHAGVHYAYLKRNDYAPLSIFDPTLATTIISANRTSERFSGAGPRAGIDLAYSLTDSFAIYGKFAGALVIGNNKVDDTSGPGQGAFAHSSTLEVIPEFEGKLGLTYTHDISQGRLVADAGYMIVNYFNVFELPANVATATSLAFQGPYLGLKWIGTIA